MPFALVRTTVKEIESQQTDEMRGRNRISLLLGHSFERPPSHEVIPGNAIWFKSETQLNKAASVLLPHAQGGGHPALANPLLLPPSGLDGKFQTTNP